MQAVQGEFTQRGLKINFVCYMEFVCVSSGLIIIIIECVYYEKVARIWSTVAYIVSTLGVPEKTVDVRLLARRERIYILRRRSRGLHATS